MNTLTSPDTSVLKPRRDIARGAQPTFWLAVALLLSISFLKLRQPMGVGSDGAHYLFAAQQLAEHGRYYSYNVNYNSADQKYKPLVQFEPGFSFAVSLVQKTTGLNGRQGARVVNGMAWLIFFGGWFNLYRMLLGHRNWYFTGASLLLIISSGLWTYLRNCQSEALFVGILALVLNALMGIYRNLGRPQAYAWTAGAGLLTAALLITRFAGIGLGLGFGLFFLFLLKKERWSAVVLKAVLYGVLSLSSVALWIARNLSVADAPFNPGIAKSHPFTLSRATEVVSLFFVSVWGIPQRVEAYAFLLLFPLVGLIGLLAWRQRRAIRDGADTPFWNPLFWLITLSGVAYVAMVVYIGKSPEFNRQAGLMRYFFLAAPFVIAFLVYTLQLLARRRVLADAKLLRWGALAFVGGLTLLYGLSNLNRFTTFFFPLAWEVPPPPDNRGVYRAIRQEVTTDDLLLSNMAQVIKFYTDRDARMVSGASHVAQTANALRGPGKRVFLVLNKKVGYQFRLGFPVWDEILPALPVEPVYEDDTDVLVELDPR